VLEVVQQKQQLPIAELVLQAFLKRLPASLPDPECLSDRRPDKERIADRGEWHKQDAVAEIIHQPGCDLQSKPGLASASRAGQR
jgi:hypothetical protein